jgi:hypothetical protein
MTESTRQKESGAMGERWAVYDKDALIANLDDVNIGLHDSGALMVFTEGQPVALFAAGSWSVATKGAPVQASE